MVVTPLPGRTAAALRLVAMAVLMAGGDAVPAAEATKPAKPAAAAKPVVKSARRAPPEPTLPRPLPEQIDAAGRVYYGAYECEFNQSVTIAKSEKHATYVDVRSGKSTWLMKPVLSTTGAVRLEDVKGETLMVQIATKSMLLNVKAGRRIVDECVSARQRELIAEAKAAKAAEVAASAAQQAASAPQAAASSAQSPASAAASASSPAFEPAASAASSATSR
jgi:hypothetical protein